MLDCHEQNAQLLKVINIAHEGIIEHSRATKRYAYKSLGHSLSQHAISRDIYYRDVPLFKSQNVVDTARLLFTHYTLRFFHSVSYSL